jgi:hypothetical protein
MRGGGVKRGGWRGGEDERFVPGGERFVIDLDFRVVEIGGHDKRVVTQLAAEQIENFSLARVARHLTVLGQSRVLSESAFDADQRTSNRTEAKSIVLIVHC